MANDNISPTPYGEEANTKKPNETVSSGVGGYKMAQGYVFDEFLPELQGERGRRKFREMKDSDATIGALLTAVDMILRTVKFDVKAKSEDMDNYYVEFVEKEMNSMDISWDEVVTEILTMLPFGFSVMEMVFKRDDEGLIRTAKLAPRSQETLQEWDVDKHGDLRGVWQWPPYGADRVYIPAKKILHFKTKNQKGNPEGISILRNGYKNYHFIKTIQMIEAIAIEREMAGLPVVKVPKAVFDNPAVLAEYEKIARDVRKNDQGGAVIPSTPYTDAEGNPTLMPQYEITLLSASGTRAIDTNQVIIRHQQDLVRTVLADFLLLGSGDRGSFALAKSKTELFLKSIEGYINVIRQQLNNKWIKTLWDLNGFPEEKCPEIVTGQLAPVNLEELGAFIRDSGLLAAADMKTENYLREVAGLPQLTEEEFQDSQTLRDFNQNSMSGGFNGSDSGTDNKSGDGE